MASQVNYFVKGMIKKKTLHIRVLYLGRKEGVIRNYWASNVIGCTAWSMVIALIVNFGETTRSTAPSLQFTHCNGSWYTLKGRKLTVVFPDFSVVIAAYD